MKLKKLLNLKKQNRREPRANEFALESLEPRLLLSATPMTAAVVTTDHQDYAPGETAVITSSSQAGELVRFQVSRTDGMVDAAGTTPDVGPAGNAAWYVIDGVGGFTAHLGSDVSGDGVADWIAPDNDLTVNSSISTSWYVEEQYRHSSLLVTASGQESGSVATQAFTDANLNTTTVVTSSGASIYGNSVTLTATVTPAVGGTTRPVGSVEFFDGATSLGVTSSAGLGAGSSSTYAITLSNLTAGSHAITAVFTGGANASDSFNNSTSGTLSQTVSKKALVGNFTADFKTYDGTTAATVLFADLTGLVGFDFVTLDGGTATFADANAGFGKTVTLTGATLGGPDAGNYTLASVATTTSDIDQAIATISVTGFTGIVDGNLHGATGTATGVLGEDLSGLLNLGAQFNTAGTHVANWTFNGGTNYFSDAGSVNIVLSVASVNTTTTISSDIAASTYGQAVTLTATVTAASGAVAPAGTVQFFDGATLLGSTNIASPTGLVSTFSLGVSNLTVGTHSAIHAVFLSSGTFFNSNSTNIVQTVSKANATFGYSGIYDGTAHGARAIGAFGEILAGMSAPTHINAGNYSDAFTFTDVSGNYNNASGLAAVAIAQANVTVSDYFGTYDGVAHGAIATGVLGENLSGLVSGTRTNVGTSLVSWTFTDVTGNYNNASGTNTVDIAVKEITGNFTVSTKVYDGTTSANVQTRTLTGVVSGDTVSLTGGSATFDTKNVGIGKTVTLVGATLTGAAAGNYTLSLLPITTTASITAKGVTGSFTAVGKVYDATTATTAVNQTLTGVIAADLGNVILSGGTATFIDANVGVGKAVTLLGATLGGTAAGNYTLASVNTATADITAKGITGSFTAANKTYDGTVSVGVGIKTLTGVLAGDVANVSLTGGTASFADKNVGIGKTVTLVGATLSGTAAGNYSLTSVGTTTANITTLGITGSFTVTATKVYDGNTSANVLTRTLTGVIGADVVTLINGAANYNNANVGTGKVVTLTGATLSGAGASNYSLTSVNTATADITAKGITGSFTAANKVYDGTTAAAVLTQTLTGVIAGDIVSLVGGTADFDTVNAGIGKTVTLTGATLAGLTAGNYNLLSVGTATANIDVLGLTGDFFADSKVYDGTTDAFVAITNLTGIVGLDDVFLDFTGATFADKNAGIGKVVTMVGATLGGLDAGNYTLASVATTTADIDALGITGDFTASNKVYDGAATASVAARTLTGAIAGDVVTLTGGTATFADKNVGTGKVVTLTGATLTGTDGLNYSLLSVGTTTANITAKGITGSFTAANKVYDATTSATVQTQSLAGVIAGDVVSLIGGTATFANANAGTSKVVALTGATLSGAAAGNYSLTSVGTTTANITALGITGSFTAANKVYDATTSATVQTQSLAGVIAGDVVSLIGGTATFANANAGTSKVVTLTGATLSGAAAGNYSLTSVGTTTANITALGITGSFTAANKVYDATTSATVQTQSLAGVIVGDVVSLIGGTATFANADAGTGKVVTLTGATLSGTAAGNYSLTSVGTATANITALGITGNFAADNKVYDGTTAAVVLFADLTGVLAADVVSLIGGTATFADANAGLGKTVTLTGATLSGTAAGNYSLLSVATTTADIDKAVATLTVTGYNGIYSGVAEQATGNALGVLGENLSGLNLSSTVHINAGTYSDTVTFTDVTGNYNNASVVVISSIGKAVVTLTGAGLNGSGYFGTYDGAAHAATVTVMGVGGVSVGTAASSTTHTNAGTYTDTVTYIDATGNYNNASKLVKSYILKATVTLTGAGLNGSGYFGTYDGAAHAATVTVKGVGGVIVGTAASSTTHTNAGTYSDTVTFLGDANYKAASKLVKSYILKATVTLTGAGLNGSGYFGTYDGAAHAATVTVTGVGGAIVGTAASSTTHTNAGTYSDRVTFLGDANYRAASKVVTSYILKATVTLTGAGLNGSGYFGTYDGAGHAATVTVKGVGGVSVGTAASSTTHTNAGTYSDRVTFLGNVNYKAASKVLTSYILKATATITVTGYNVVFDGAAHTATATATGINGENLSAGLSLAGTTHTAKGVYLGETVTFTGGTNYKDVIRFVSNRIS